MRRSLLVLALLFLPLGHPTAEEPLAPGRSTRELGGTRYELLVPAPEQAKDGYSLLVILHGMGGTATGMVGTGQAFLDLGFVTCAPKSKGNAWEPSDLENVRAIASLLIQEFDVPVNRRHAAGFSNGGWNLTPVAFDEKLHFRTATWIAAGYQGGRPPRWAAKEMGCLALAGAQDGNRKAAQATVGMLADKVKFVDCRIQPNLGHAFPRDLVPYWHYVMEVMEGRFAPGDQRSYEWSADLEQARATMADKELGGFVYVYSKDADEDELALTRTYQNEALFDRLAGHYGRQLVAVKLEKGEAGALLAEARVKSTPAVVVLRRGGAKVSKALTGKLAPARLAQALRAVAKDRSPPE